LTNSFRKQTISHLPFFTQLQSFSGAWEMTTHKQACIVDIANSFDRKLNFSHNKRLKALRSECATELGFFRSEITNQAAKDIEKNIDSVRPDKKSRRLREKKCLRQDISIFHGSPTDKFVEAAQATIWSEIMI
jgi:hypothetical protein